MMARAGAGAGRGGAGRGGAGRTFPGGDGVLPRLERTGGRCGTGASMGMAGHFGAPSDLVGYLGAATVIGAYFLNQKGRLGSGDWRFPAMNLLGSALVLVSLLFHPNLPSVVIEVFWSAISV